MPSLSLPPHTFRPTPDSRRPAGEVVPFREKEICPPTGLTLNGRLFVSNKDHLDALVSVALFLCCSCCVNSYNLTSSSSCLSSSSPRSLLLYTSFFAHVFLVLFLTLSNPLFLSLLFVFFLYCISLHSPVFYFLSLFYIFSLFFFYSIPYPL